MALVGHHSSRSYFKLQKQKLCTCGFSIVLRHSNYSNRLISVVSLFSWDTLYIVLYTRDESVKICRWICIILLFINNFNTFPSFRPTYLEVCPSTQSIYNSALKFAYYIFFPCRNKSVPGTCHGRITN